MLSGPHPAAADASTADRVSLVRRLASRVGNPLEWSAADKCLLVGVVLMLPFTAWFAVLGWYVARRPEVAPYIDRDFLRVALAVQVWAFTGGWLAIVAAALWLRRRAPESRVIVHLTIQFFCVTVPLFSYFVGIVTSELIGVLELGGAIVGRLLFDKRSVFFGIITFQLVFVATLVGGQIGLFPYAPLLTALPVTAGRLAGTWVVGFGLPVLVFGWAGYFLIYYVFDRWHAREDQLARTSEQLARANDVISRYVASQLASQILAGNYDAAERHERRKLTLFFSDIRGFAETADQVEPEDLSAVLNEYLSEMALIGDRYGGTIDKFVGDAIMIFFGAPLSTNDRDHALRSVRMAIEMQERMVTLRERWLREGFERPFEIRIGINTGQASIGNFGSKGRMDYTAIGRQVNLAARLQTHCEPGKILLSHSTWVLVHEQIPCVTMGEIQVKGFQNPVRVYEVVAGRADAPG
jgi:adenylate cyclase